MIVSDSKQRIRDLLDYLGISQNELARRCGLEKSSVSHFLSGRRIPNQNSLYSISSAFNVDVAWLMGYDVPMFTDKKQVDQVHNADLLGKILADDNMCQIVSNLSALSPDSLFKASSFISFLLNEDKKQ